MSTQSTTLRNQGNKWHIEVHLKKFELKILYRKSRSNVTEAQEKMSLNCGQSIQIMGEKFNCQILRWWESKNEHKTSNMISSSTRLWSLAGFWRNHLFNRKYVSNHLVASTWQGVDQMSLGRRSGRNKCAQNTLFGTVCWPAYSFQELHV